jgi:hypothetical protein
MKHKRVIQSFRGVKTDWREDGETMLENAAQPLFNILHFAARSAFRGCEVKQKHTIARFINWIEMTF